MWSYSPPIEKAEPLHEHIDPLWAKRQPHKDCLLSLKESLTADVFLGYRANFDTAV